eukprot:1136325-Pelagomonas_calceolata.AAC.2
MPRWYDKIQATAVPLWHGMWWCHAYDEIQTTVVTRAEPHNLRLVHPTQHRVLSIRENARCQADGCLPGAAPCAQHQGEHALPGVCGGRGGKVCEGGQDVCLAQHHMLSIRDDVCGYVCALLFVKFYAGGLNAAYRCKIEYGTV